MDNVITGLKFIFYVIFFKSLIKFVREGTLYQKNCKLFRMGIYLINT